MLRVLVLVAGLVVSFSAVSSHAQEVVLGQLYGNGVHAYFASDFVKSFEQLTAAVTAGSRDPRVYYFRGLAYLKLGREPEAVQDFRKGAELESKDLNRSYNVGRSLERVQGMVRQQLETYRVDARLAAIKEATKIRKARFEAIQHEEQRVLRTQAAQAPAEVISPPATEPSEKASATDPFGNPAEAKEAVKSDEAQAAATPPAKTEDAAAFGGGETAEKPAAEGKAAPKTSILKALLKGSEAGIKKSVGENVGGLGNMLPIGKGPAGAAAPGGNALPGATPAATDPFGSAEEKPAPPSKAEAEKPATEATPPADPFGGGAEEKKPATTQEKPAGSAEDPFKEEPAPPEKPAT